MYYKDLILTPGRPFEPHSKLKNNPSTFAEILFQIHFLDFKNPL